MRSSPPGALVYLDDALVGPAPQRLRATSGLHVLRVEAPGYRSYGRAIEVLEGARPAHAVSLAPDEPLAAARRLSHALSHLDADAVSRFLVAAGFEEAWSLRLGSRPDRALVTPCWSAGCGPPARVASPTDLEIASPEVALGPQALETALRSGRTLAESAGPGARGPILRSGLVLGPWSGALPSRWPRRC